MIQMLTADRLVSSFPIIEIDVKTLFETGAHDHVDIQPQVYTLYVIRTTETWFGQPDETSMFSFGEFYSLDADKVSF